MWCWWIYMCVWCNSFIFNINHLQDSVTVVFYFFMKNHFYVTLSSLRELSMSLPKHGLLRALIEGSTKNKAFWPTDPVKPTLWRKQVCCSVFVTEVWPTHTFSVHHFAAAVFIFNPAHPSQQQPGPGKTQECIGQASNGLGKGSFTVPQGSRVFVMLDFQLPLPGYFLFFSS